MKEGDIVRNKKTGQVGRVAYSTFGFSIHWKQDGMFTKTLGAPREKLEQMWEIIKEEEKE